MNNRVGALGTLLAVAVVLPAVDLLTASAAGQEIAVDELVLLDGSKVSGVIQSIGSDGAITGEGLPASLQLDGLRSIRCSVADDRSEGDPDHATEAFFLGGGTLGLMEFTIDENQDCQIESPALGKIALPIDAFTAVRFSADKMDASFAAAMKEKLDEDRIFVKTDNGVRVLRGLIETMTGSSLGVDRGDGVRPIPRERVYGIVFAQIGRLPKRAGQCQITLSDGSSFWAKVDSLADGKLNVQVAGKAAATVPWSKVIALKVRSTRIEFLSDLEPIDARHQPLVTLERPMQVDRSIGGRPLTLANQVYEKGLGVASRSVVSFANEGDFDLFAATIGIDAETQGRGDCIFVVEADGREIFRERMTGKSPPKQLALNVQGVERVTLIVEPGEDLDLADHANWCDARFVRK